MYLEAVLALVVGTATVLLAPALVWSSAGRELARFVRDKLLPR